MQDLPSAGGDRVTLVAASMGQELRDLDEDSAFRAAMFRWMGVGEPLLSVRFEDGEVTLHQKLADGALCAVENGLYSGAGLVDLEGEYTWGRSQVGRYWVTY